MSRAAKIFDPYRGRDPREIPVYGISEASHYLLVPERTLQDWVQGYSFRRGPDRQRRQAVVPADQTTGLLSFADLLELHVLSALRRERVSLQNIRHARDYLQQKWGAAHPLITEEMATDGTHIFVRKLGALLDASTHGQVVLEEIISVRLKRIERDSTGLAVRLYPFTRRGLIEHPNAPTLVTIDPRQMFGRPVITGSRVPTEEIAERFFAGDSFDTLVNEYGRRPDEIAEAIGYEAWRGAAA